MERLYGRGLARHGVAWVVTSAGPLWKLDLTNACHRWIVYGDYEGSAQMNWAWRWLRDGDVVVDSGANIGQMLLYLASAHRIRVLAIEPLPGAREWLQECLALQPGWNVVVLSCGLGACSEKLSLRVQGEQSTLRTDWYTSSDLKTVEVEVHTLDSVLAEARIEQVRLWKLDVEGAELPAIRGASEALRSRRIEAVLVESTPRSFAGLKDAFAAVGFSMLEFDRSGRTRAATGNGFGNLLALPVEGKRAGSQAVFA